MMSLKASGMCVILTMRVGGNLGLVWEKLERKLTHWKILIWPQIPLEASMQFSQIIDYCLSAFLGGFFLQIPVYFSKQSAFD